MTTMELNLSKFPLTNTSNYLCEAHQVKKDRILFWIVEIDAIESMH